MKKLIPFIIITLSLFFLNSCFKANDNVGHDGRCTGSAYCSACKNCSRCGHCSGGGTCGVCDGGSSGRSTKKRAPKKSKASESDNFKSTSSKKSKSNKAKAPSVFINEINVNTNSRYIAGTATTNIYAKPSLKSKIIATVPKNTKLVQLSKQGSWYKVQIKKDGKQGFVYYKDVK